ncbi:hypothetical protein BJF85_23815 [Saccharomonospora sp. CUA-673]|uniref:YbaB/EbfC family nucleoid-associated protein n=1 Tax=Saccharomonospora sp. CUA-673 TaxID=1904969 RepID=UPI00095C5DA1|nr:YbaB/EbfC family nucleoid-associated protein [Saccharomonospora sp. CUA-673]OLT41365.1 hypothetical protein BJF85_23815 [Saccharomonospora sp. CUA-673]
MPPAEVGGPSGPGSPGAEFVALHPASRDGFTATITMSGETRADGADLDALADEAAARLVGAAVAVTVGRRERAGVAAAGSLTQALGVRVRAGSTIRDLAQLQTFVSMADQAGNRRRAILTAALTATPAQLAGAGLMGDFQAFLAGIESDRPLAPAGVTRAGIDENRDPRPNSETRSGMTEPGEQLMRRIEAIDTAAADNARAAEAYQRVTEELAQVRGEVTSPDGVVTVVAGADGAVERVTFGDGVRRLAPTELSATVTHTIAEARYAAARAQAEIVRRAFGDTELLDRVLDADVRVFGDRRPRDPGPPPVGYPGHGRGRHHIDTEPEDYSQLSYVRRGR